MPLPVIERPTSDAEVENHLEHLVSPYQNPAVHERLEKAYGKGRASWSRLLLFSVVVLWLMQLSFSIFGSRLDSIRYTSEVTPIHIPISTIEDKNPEHSVN